MSDNALIKYDEKTLATLKATVAQGATDAEFAMFVEMCRSTGLNPFKRELWFIKAGGRVQMMTGINGFHSIANAAPEYDGMETGLVGKDGAYLPLTHPTNDYIGAWARVHRKDRKVPCEGVAMLQEYDKGTGNWKQMKRVMIQKCAESVALRKAFPQQLNGLYTAEEMPVEYSIPVVEVTSAETPRRRQARPAEQAGPLEPDGPFRYALPYRSEFIDCDEWRTKLKRAGFNPDRSKKPWEWVGSVEFEELAGFLVSDIVDDPGPGFDDDSLPAEWEAEGGVA